MKKASGDASDNPVHFSAKWAKVLKSIPEFVGIADAASKDELKKIILQCEANIYTTEQDKETNATLNSLKEQLKEATEPYTDALKVQKAKINYALYLLESKGEDLSGSTDED